MSKKKHPHSLIEFLDKLEPSDNINTTRKTKAVLTSDDDSWEFDAEECQKIFQDVTTTKEFFKIVEDELSPEETNLELVQLEVPSDVYDLLEEEVSNLETY